MLAALTGIASPKTTTPPASGGGLSVDQLARDLASQRDLGNGLESEDGEDAKLCAPTPVFASASAAPVFELRPHFGRKVNKNYLEGMLKRATAGNLAGSPADNPPDLSDEDMSEDESELLQTMETTSVVASAQVPPKKNFNFLQYAKTS